ncbi:uncharacterized protein LOC106349315 [Brassica napus]|uniref:uncharacterized protein LOC106349315 n=1 Tax=Brassica napus TaxID=3708 RepID=UPI002078ED49|nr:uncharacterized protein LOC106349315 [Brassica napus]
MELNPKTERRKWRYTWEAQSHSPNLRLFLFDSETNPKNHCNNLNVSILPEKSQLLVTWNGSEAEGREDGVSLRVPVPRVLLDAESTVKFRALDDHIEVRLALLLPVDHPLVSDLVIDGVKSAPLAMEYDVKALTLMGGVHLHCRKCSVRLTKRALFEFSEMPSVNWRESADNWFGTCCCSFGGISEKMVVKYTNSYACSSGLCLLSATTVLLSEDDLVECVLSDKVGTGRGCDLGGVELGSGRSEVNSDSHEDGCEVDDSRDKASSSVPECCVHDESPGSSESFELDQKLTLDKKFLLDGFLEDVFMAKASNVSKNVDWIELACPECSSPLGAYPSGCGSNDKPIDGGVRLFKCYISTSSATNGESSDVFRRYTLGRMFTNQLVECAKEELSFHVLVNDLTTKSHLFQIIILNPNSWSLTGLCSSLDEAGSTLELRPIVKVLFSDCKSALVKKVDEEVYILKGQGEELIELLTRASKFLPSSCAYLQGSLVSSMHL